MSSMTNEARANFIKFKTALPDVTSDPDIVPREDETFLETSSKTTDKAAEAKRKGTVPIFKSKKYAYVLFSVQMTDGKEDILDANVVDAANSVYNASSTEVQVAYTHYCVPQGGAGLTCGKQDEQLDLSKLAKVYEFATYAIDAPEVNSSAGQNFRAGQVVEYEVRGVNHGIFIGTSETGQSANEALYFSESPGGLRPLNTRRASRLVSGVNLRRPKSAKVPSVSGQKAQNTPVPPPPDPKIPLPTLANGKAQFPVNISPSGQINLANYSKSRENKLWKNRIKTVMPLIGNANPYNVLICTFKDYYGKTRTLKKDVVMKLINAQKLYEQRRHVIKQKSGVDIGDLQIKHGETFRVARAKVRPAEAVKPYNKKTNPKGKLNNKFSSGGAGSAHNYGAAIDFLIPKSVQGSRFFANYVDLVCSCLALSGWKRFGISVVNGSSIHADIGGYGRQDYYVYIGGKPKFDDADRKRSSGRRTLSSKWKNTQGNPASLSTVLSNLKTLDWRNLKYG